MNKKPKIWSRTLIPLAILALSGGVLVQHCTAKTTASTPKATASKALTPPEVFLPDLQGKKHSLNEWQSKVRLVNFWATWCGPCRQEIPLLRKMQEKYTKKNLQIIGIALDDEDSINPFLRKTPVNYPILFAEDMDFGTKIGADFGNKEDVLPYTVMLDSAGKIVWQHTGLLEAEDLEKAIQQHLPKSSK